MVTDLAANFAKNGPDVTGLTRLLRYLEKHSIKSVLVEAPWSPPIREKFAPVADAYRQTVEAVTRAHGAQYLDVNRWVNLGPEHFHDTFHVDTAGADLCLKALAEQLAGAGN